MTRADVDLVQIKKKMENFKEDRFSETHTFMSTVRNAPKKRTVLLEGGYLLKLLKYLINMTTLYTFLYTIISCSRCFFFESAN